MDDDVRRFARSFGSVAHAYDRGRPSFPRKAAAWLTGEEPVTVLELGAGTGKLTEQLVALGHDVHATDPDQHMLDILTRNLPDTRASLASAEELPVPDGSVDVVVAAQSFHWFDHDRALPEIARVLKPGGRLAVVWNLRDPKIPWVRRLGDIIGSVEEVDPEPLVLSGLFGFVEEETFSFWQDINRDTIQDLVLSRSNVATLDEDAQAAKLDEVLAFYDDYGRGMDGMQLHYNSRCFRAVVNEPANPDAADAPDDRPNGGGDRPPDPGPSDGTDTGMLLIDFK